MLYKVGSDTGKDRILFSSLKITEGPNAIHFPHTCDEEFFKQLTGEVRKIEFSRGMKRQVWVKKRDRQEILDLHVYNLAAYAILNPDIGAILAKREVRAPKEEAKLAKTTQKRRIVRNKKNWATDF